MKTNEVGNTLKHPKTINSIVKNLSKSSLKNLTIPLINNILVQTESETRFKKKIWSGRFLEVSLIHILI